MPDDLSAYCRRQEAQSPAGQGGKPAATLWAARHLGPQMRLAASARCRRPRQARGARRDEKGTDMNRITAAHARISQARDLPDLLSAAFDAFEDMLVVIRHHEERDDRSFAAFVIAACAAADGRDCLAPAPSLLALGPVPNSGTDGLLAELTVAQVARTVAGLGALLAARLTSAAAAASHPADQAACTSAARQATQIWTLFFRAREP
jgi:hypothetical protein